MGIAASWRLREVRDGMSDGVLAWTYGWFAPPSRKEPVRRVSYMEGIMVELLTGLR